MNGLLKLTLAFYIYVAIILIFWGILFKRALASAWEDGGKAYTGDYDEEPQPDEEKK